MNNPFKNGISISKKLLMLMVLISLAFVLVATMVLGSLFQVKELSTDVATTQMSRVISNSEVTRGLLSVFGDIDQLSFLMDKDGSSLTSAQNRLQFEISQITQTTTNLELKERLNELTRQLDKIIGQYQSVNRTYNHLNELDRSINITMSRFEADVSNQLINATIAGEDAPYIRQVMSLITGYRQSLLQIEKQNAALMSAFLMPLKKPSDRSIVPLIDDLLLRLETLSASPPEISGYGDQISALLSEYRASSLAMESSIGLISNSLVTLAVHKKGVLKTIEQTDEQTNQTVRKLADDLEAIVRSSGVSVLLLSLSVMLLLAMIIFKIVKTSINQPLKQIISGIEEFRQGRLLNQISVHDISEWSTIGEALNKMANDLHLSYSELKESEDKFYQVFENELNGLLIFDQDTGLCLDANRVALDLYGYSLREIKKIRVQDFEITLQEAPQVDGNEGWINTYHRRRDGRRFPVEVHTGIFQRQGCKYLFKSVRDKTHERHLQRMQKKTLSLLEATLESTGEGILALSQEGMVLNFNKKFSQLFNIPASKIKEKTGKQILPLVLQQLQDRKQFKMMIRRSHQGTKTITNEVFKLKDGRMFECHSQPQLLGNEVVGRVWNFRDVSEYFNIMDELRDKESRLAHLAHHDPLTGLANRLLFVDRLEHAIHKAKRSRKKLALFFIDLDRFKSINDSLGHIAGDMLLKSFAERLTSTVRQIDTIARLGGDEFTLILDSIDSAQDAANVALKILDSLNMPFEANEHRFYVTSSIGISFYPQDGTSAEVLLRNADAAMYRSKNEGRNTFHFYTEDMTVQAYERVKMEASLRAALDENQFVVYYQPQYDLACGRLMGAEALVRWQHPQHGLIGPDRFLPTAEEAGLIVSVDEWVFTNVCKNLAEMEAKEVNLEGIRVAVNLSGGQLKQESLPETFAKIIDQTGCNSSFLELEITEGFIMDQPDLATRILYQLRDLGLQLSIDDFGTGYSSLSYLKRLPINKLKIDRSFVMDIVDDPNDAAIAKSVIALGHSMNLQVVAEGIEEPEQELFLKAEGCDMGQGYLYSRPVDASEFAALLKKGSSYEQAI
ncbi:bifunctional diguanylate cyclase/phosphodiesterase [Motiliproteus sp. MSK22-1]|uniref:bifunctional diguanylate cyclase/phosphodiesterase n=1 Tax=Motiliproteus sp. MSK22-1 TaxID=1897630 RepID=UPI00117BF1EB|nr:bifunctional diguanylate cyclase/phosphodiesterase [Motiliproteus sp. MSK22-1]